MACLSVTTQNLLLALCHDGTLFVFDLMTELAEYKKDYRPFKTEEVELVDPFALIEDFDIESEAKYIQAL